MHCKYAAKTGGGRRKFCSAGGQMAGFFWYLAGRARGWGAVWGRWQPAEGFLACEITRLGGDIAEKPVNTGVGKGFGVVLAAKVRELTWLLGLLTWKYRQFTRKIVVLTKISM